MSRGFWEAVGAWVPRPGEPERLYRRAAGFTAADLADLRALAAEAQAWSERGHDDNTNAPCRRDLNGHDCCEVCNRVEAVLKAWREALP